MIWLAIAVLASAGMFAFLAKHIFDQWMLAQRTQEQEDDVVPSSEGTTVETSDETDMDPESIVQLIRGGPTAQDRRDIERWRKEKQDDGLDDDEIDALLRSRTPVVRL